MQSSEDAKATSPERLTRALDSFALVELLATLEDEFDVEIPVEDLEVDHFRTARCIAALIAART
jgi:acyl carrier protein